jgi:hypothetical protein
VNPRPVALAIPAIALLVGLAAIPEASADRRRNGAVRPYSRGGGGWRTPARVRYVPRYGYGWGYGPYWGVVYRSPGVYYYDAYPSVGYAYAGEPAVVAAPSPEPPVPRVAVGVFAGGTHLAQDAERGGRDVGLVGRFRLTPHLGLEAELSKSELGGGERVDRSFGGALFVDLTPWSKLSVYLLGGAGLGASAYDGGDDRRHTYAELGAGIEWRLVERLSLIGDLRGGRRDVEEPEYVIQRGERVTILPGPDADDSSGYTRGRIGLLLSF